MSAKGKGKSVASATPARDVPNDPARAGCADGQREAFLDQVKFPHIAGCAGTWAGRASLRAAGKRKPAQQACGDDAGPCPNPQALCAPGWHICGHDGTVAELRVLSSKQCRESGPGRFVAAISHCQEQDGCSYDQSRDANYPCFREGPCSEPVCCGDACSDDNECSSGVWPQQTRVARQAACAATGAQSATGVLCCEDGAVESSSRPVN